MNVTSTDSAKEPHEETLAEHLDRLDKELSRLGDIKERLTIVADRIAGPVPTEDEACGASPGHNGCIRASLDHLIIRISARVFDIGQTIGRIERAVG